MALISGTDYSDILDQFDGVTNGDDTIYGWGGNDIISGLGGNDGLVGGLGADYLNGGSGTDTAYYGDSSEAVLVTLESGQGYGGTAEGDTLVSIENLIGSAYGDSLYGNDGSNVLDGAGGNDTLKGGGGADTLNGGAGSDTASYAFSSAGVVVNLYSDIAKNGDAEGDELNSIENLTGSAYADTFWGDDGINVLKGMDGDDTLKGFGGADKLYGGDDNDALYGMTGVDVLYGENGADYLDGGSDNDNLSGGYGADTLVGGTGADTLTGGVGADTFKFLSLADSTVAAPDDITDFSDVNGDKIDLSKIDANTLLPGDQAFTWIGNDNNFVEAWGAGQLRFNGGYLEGDVDGDFNVDFRIEVNSASLHDYAFVL